MLTVKTVFFSSSKIIRTLKYSKFDQELMKHKTEVLLQEKQKSSQRIKHKLFTSNEIKRNTTL